MPLRTSALSIFAFLGLASSSAIAASVAINFSTERVADDDLFDTSLTGPTNISGTNWNHTANNASGTINNLIDDTGASTTVSLSYSSQNTWSNNAGTANNNKKLSVGYLDDSGAGPNITLTGLSSLGGSSYNVYIILGSDSGNGGTYTSEDITLNGVGIIGQSFTALGHHAFGAGSAPWIQATASVTGDYILGSANTDTLTITNAGGTGRGSIAGVIVEAVPEPSSTALLGIAGCLLVIRRRR
ncbi:PEP-CTERM sorting domain-containing protein [Rubritalea tangerina]|uniref:PEP-CTERM sorting domain-containing protein n=1 Tax=Rubritalea tangerina TaxID=430798 RepID=A0ABW4ZEP5_9BACT